MGKIQEQLEKLMHALTDPIESSYFSIHSVRYSQIIHKVSFYIKKKPSKILDIGCFPYHVGKVLEEMGHSVYGIASAHEPVRNKNIHVLNVEKDKFPFEDNFFDFVLFNEIIEHLPQSPMPALSEIYRVLKPGGYCMITTPNGAKLIHRIKMCMGKPIMFPVNVYFENNGKGNIIYHRHNREYMLSELREICLQFPWKVLYAQRIISYPPWRKKVEKESVILQMIKWINYCIGYVVPAFRDTNMVIVQK